MSVFDSFTNSAANVGRAVKDYWRPPIQFASTPEPPMQRKPLGIEAAVREQVCMNRFTKAVNPRSLPHIDARLRALSQPRCLKPPASVGSPGSAPKS